MTPFVKHSGRVAPLDKADVDTDQIIPKQFLKRIERSGFGEFLFFDWRKDPDFVLNRPEYQSASILVTGPNFGCGSSREHAPWAIQDYGFRAVIAPSFSDIFRTNCLKIGLLPVQLPEATVRELMRADEVTVDLDRLVVSADGVEHRFEIDEFSRVNIMEGLDEIGLTERREDAITAFESTRPDWMPTVKGMR